MSEELRRDRSLPKFAQAITLYHLIVEGTDGAARASTSSRTSSSGEGTMPGFSEGMENVSRDEQRHIGFGVKVLNELIRERATSARRRSSELLGEVMPWVFARSSSPPGWNLDYTRCYGFEIEDIAEGDGGGRAEVAGDRLPDGGDGSGVIPIDLTLAAGEARDGGDQAPRSPGVVGEPGPVPTARRETQEMYFDLGRRVGRPGAATARPFTVQWRFNDAEAWHWSSTTARPRGEAGTSTDADVTLESSWRDFIEIGKGAIAPPRALLQRRLKLRGGARNLLKFAQADPPRGSRMSVDSRPHARGALRGAPRLPLGAALPRLGRPAARADRRGHGLARGPLPRRADLVVPVAQGDPAACATPATAASPPTARVRPLRQADRLGWYSYDRHVEDADARCSSELEMRDATFVVHDWGGPVGHADRRRAARARARLVIMDTGVFTGHQRMSDAWKMFRDFVERTEDLPISMLVRALQDGPRRRRGRRLRRAVPGGRRQGRAPAPSR